MKRRKISRSP